MTPGPTAAAPAATPAAAPAAVDPRIAKILDEVQGNILRAYGKQYQVVRHLVLSVANRDAARRALAQMVDGDRSTPDVTRAQRHPSELGFQWCLNVGFTYQGLKALGVPERSLATFPPEFVEGMVTRATRLGDIGPSAPAHWVGGLGDADRVHLIVTIHGCSQSDVERLSDQILAVERRMAFSLVSDPLDGAVMVDQATDRRIVHFGYADGISQPRFIDIHGPEDRPDRLPFSPLGLVLLGYPSAIPHVSWQVPTPSELGHNGTFNAFRVLGQDVTAFDAFLTTAVAEHGGADGIPDLDRELVAAKLCGRWRNGVPLSLAPTWDLVAAVADDKLNDFDYVGGAEPDDADPDDADPDDADPDDAARRVDPDPDPDGVACPIGAHIRRANPRGAHIVQRSANRTRSLIRRGIPYGPPWKAEDPATWDVERGLLGNFICGSLAAQFEAMQYDWLNLGLQDPRITGSNDPLVGVNVSATSSFTWPLADQKKVVLRGLPRFVSTRGGAYTFLASLPAIAWIAALTE